MNKMKQILCTLFLLVGIAHQIETAANLNDDLLANAKVGNTQTIIALLDAGAVIDYQDDFGSTALFYAAAQGNVETVIALLDRGAEIDHANHRGHTPLFGAIEKGKTAVVVVLLDRSASIEHQTDRANRALYLAAWYGNLEIVNILIDRGARVDLVNDSGDTALLGATNNGYNDIVVALLDRGASVNHWNNYGETALFVAIKNGDKDIAVTLLDKGANVYRADNQGREALNLYKSRQRHDQVHALQAHMALDIAKIDEMSIEVDIAAVKEYLEEITADVEKGLKEVAAKAYPDNQESIEKKEREAIKIEEREAITRIDEQEAIEMEKSWVKDFKQAFKLYTENKSNRLADLIFGITKNNKLTFYSSKHDYTSQVLALLRSPKLCKPLLDDLADIPARKKIAQEMMKEKANPQLRHLERQEAILKNKEEIVRKSILEEEQASWPMRTRFPL